MDMIEDKSSNRKPRNYYWQSPSQFPYREALAHTAQFSRKVNIERTNVNEGHTNKHSSACSLRSCLVDSINSARDAGVGSPPAPCIGAEPDAPLELRPLLA